MDWKAKALALWSGVKAKVCALFNDHIVDPPPARLKVYFWVVLAGSLAGYFFWTPIFNGVRSVFAPVYQAATPLPLIPRLPSVVTTVPPVVAPKASASLPPLAKVITADTVAPAKAVPGATKKVVRKKRKPKCQTVFC